MENTEEQQGQASNDQQLVNDGSSGIATDRQEINEDKRSSAEAASPEETGTWYSIALPQTTDSEYVPPASHPGFNEVQSLPEEAPGTIQAKEDRRSRSEPLGRRAQEEGDAPGRKKRRGGPSGRRRRILPRASSTPSIDSARMSNESGRASRVQQLGPQEPSTEQTNCYSLVDHMMGNSMVTPSFFNGSSAMLPPFIPSHNNSGTGPTLQELQHLFTDTQMLPQESLEQNPVAITVSNVVSQQQARGGVAPEPNNGQVPSEANTTQEASTVGDHYSRQVPPVSQQIWSSSPVATNVFSTVSPGTLLPQQLLFQLNPAIQALPHRPSLMWLVPVNNASTLNADGMMTTGRDVMSLPPWQLQTGVPIQPPVPVSLGEPMPFLPVATTSSTNHHPQEENHTRPHSTPGTPMFMPLDVENLSEYQILIRKQIEYFIATEDDASSSVQGRKKKITQGQVGLRCKHCSHVHRQERRGMKGSVYFPMKLEGIYQAAQNIATTHLNKSCLLIDPHIKAELNRLREIKVTAAGGKQYWAELGKAMGIYESETGLRMSRRRRP